MKLTSVLTGIHRVTLLLCACLASAGCRDQQASPPLPAVKPDKPAIEHQVRIDGRYRERRFLREHDKFIAEDTPRIVSAREAIFLNDEDEVLGFVINGQARAYSVRMLCYHHVVNDMIGDTPLAVTY